MGTGPEVTSGFDLALTELDDGFVVRSGTAAGERPARRARRCRPASEAQQADARAAVAAARERIGDPVPTAGLPARLIAAADSPRWAEIAERCLACANCTLVCPTCFCTSVTQVSDLDGVESVAERTWDSCFTSRLRQGRRRQLPAAHAGPLPPVADPQVRDVVGPVRDVGLRRLRALHHVVPGRHRRPRGAPGRGAAARAAVRRSRPWRPPSPPPRRPAARPPARPLPVIDAQPPTYARAFVVERRRETHDVVTLRLEVDDPALLAGRPGQFVMAALPAFSAAPISVSRFLPDGLELTIRAAGRRDARPVRPPARRLARRPRPAGSRLAGRGRRRPRRRHRHRRHRPRAAAPADRRGPRRPRPVRDRPPAVRRADARATACSSTSSRGSSGRARPRRRPDRRPRRARVARSRRGRHRAVRPGELGRRDARRRSSAGPNG